MWTRFAAVPLAMIDPFTVSVFLPAISTSAHGSMVSVPWTLVSKGTRCGLPSAVHVSVGMFPGCWVPAPVALAHSLVAGG